MKQARLSAEFIPDDIKGYYEARFEKRGTLPPATGPFRIPRFTDPGPTRVYRTRAMFWYLRQFLNCQTVLEAGCGRGNSSIFLKRIFTSVTSFDISPSLANFAARWAGVETFVANVDMFTPETNYDLIVMTEVLEHTLDPLSAAHRYLAHCAFMVASSPVAEGLNPAGAFNLDRLNDVRAAGDTTGHIWSLDVEGFEDLFREYTILHSEVVGPSCLVLVRGKAPLPPVPSGRERILPWESV